MKRVFLILLIPFSFLIGTMVLIKYVLFPKFSSMALDQLEKYSEKNLPVILKIKNAEFGYTNGTLVVNHIQIIPTSPDLTKKIRKIQIQSVSFQLALFPLLTGKIELSHSLIQHPEIFLNAEAIFSDNKSPPKQIPVNEIFDTIEKIPLQKLQIKDIDLYVQGTNAPAELQIHKAQILIANRLPLIAGRIQVPEIKITSANFPELYPQFDAQIAWTRQSLNILNLQTKLNGLEAQLKGQIQDFKNITIHPKARVQLNTSFELDEIKTLAQSLDKKIHLPFLKGRVKLNGQVEMDGIKKTKGEIDFIGNSLSIQNFEIGDLNFKANIDSTKLHLPKIELNHSAGNVTLTNSSLSLESPYELISTVESPKLDLQSLFKSIHLSSIPVWLTTKGKLNCQGFITDFHLDCEGKIFASDLDVKADMKPLSTRIVQLKEGEALGKIHIDKREVNFDTQVTIKNSKGRVRGRVEYQEGFKIDFEEAKINVTDIDYLVGLKFDGTTSLTGFTEGNSSTAKLELNLDAQNFALENHYLGQVKQTIKYNKSHLYVKNIDAKIDSSNYQGEIDIDLEHERLSGKFHSPNLNLIDVKRIFRDIYLFPLDIDSKGQAVMNFEGPFDFWKMSYDLLGEFHGGTVQGESFQKLKVRLNSVSGDMKIQDFIIQKNSSTMTIKGGIDSQQKLQILADITDWRLEDSEIIGKIRSNILGGINVSSSLTGNIKDPHLQLKANVVDVYFDEQDIPSSFFDLNLSKRQVQLVGNIFGNKIQGDLSVPLGQYELPLRVRLKTNEWAFANVLSLIGAGKLQSEYDSSVSVDLDIKSDSGKWENSDGQIKVKKFYLKRGSQYLKNNDDMEVNVKHGKISLQNFSLEGGKQSIEFRGKDFDLNDMKLNVNAFTDLRLWHILVPFLDETGGPVELTASITGPLIKPQIFGTAKIKDGFIRIKGFPHPIERIETDILFSHSRILIQNLHGGITGGHFTGEGIININALNDIPINIKAHAEGLNLEVPDKVKSSGSADLSFTGNQFPFLLSGHYYVNQALIEKEFTTGVDSGIKESPYLPKLLKEANFDPVVLNILVHLEKPAKVKNSILDSLISGEITVRGPPQSPLLFGKISTEKSSKLFFKDKVFEIQSGVVNFENPKEINPDLYIAAQSRVADYDISLLVQGPAKDPNIRMNSVPPLPDSDILSLLALGVTSSRLDQNIQSKEQATRAGYEAGAAIFSQSGIDKFTEQRLGVNVQFTSSFDSTKNISVPKITFSKNLSRKWNAAVSRSVGAEQTSNEAKLQYQINNNVSAIGSWEGREASENTRLSGSRESQSIFGLDLEFKKEFK